MTHEPTDDELARIIAMLEKQLWMWRGNTMYGRQLEIELFCARAAREALFNLAQRGSCHE